MEREPALIETRKGKASSNALSRENQEDSLTSVTQFENQQPQQQFHTLGYWNGTSFTPCHTIHPNTSTHQQGAPITPANESGNLMAMPATSTGVPMVGPVDGQRNSAPVLTLGPVKMNALRSLGRMVDGVAHNEQSSDRPSMRPGRHSLYVAPPVTPPPINRPDAALIVRHVSLSAASEPPAYVSERR